MTDDLRPKVPMFGAPINSPFARTDNERILALETQLAALTERVAVLEDESRSDPLTQWETDST